MNERSTDLERLPVDGLTWPESPRWQDGALWFSDVHNFRVVRVVPGEPSQTVADMPGRPGGMGFMPDGRLLVATALDRRLCWVSVGKEPELAADLSAFVKGLLNDMVVDRHGRAWVGDTGFDLLKGEAEVPGRLLSWTEGEGHRVAAEDLRFPNGIAISEDGGTLYVAETFGSRISAFALADDGTLSARRVHAELSGRPDGMCLDDQGHLWVALLWDCEFQRIAPDGQVAERIALGKERAVSCVLGGAERRELFLGVCEIDDADKTRISRVGSIRRSSAMAAGSGVP